MKQRFKPIKTRRVPSIVKRCVKDLIYDEAPGRVIHADAESGIAYEFLRLPSDRWFVAEAPRRHAGPR